MANYKTIAESNNFIVLDKYEKFSELNEAPASYQTEADLEKELVKDLANQGYTYHPEINNQQTMLTNVRLQLQHLNDMKNI